MPGATVLPKTDNDVLLKVGRIYIYNPLNAPEMEVESGRVKVQMPPGSSGIIDTAANGLTQYSQLTGTQPTRVVDLCNTAVQLEKVAVGNFVTVAPEDAVAEDLIAV